MYQSETNQCGHVILIALGKSKGICYPGQIVGVRNDNKVVVQMNNDRYVLCVLYCLTLDSF